MTKLIGLKGDNALSTPALTKYITKDISDEGLDHNWKNYERTPCKQCNGTGYDLQDQSPCIACDGTGIDFYLCYGVEDGVAYAKVVQNGVEAIKEVCKAKRERETKNWVKQQGKEVFMIPNGARLELVAQGYPVDDWEAEGDMRSYAKAVRKHFPEFMTTNLII